MEALREKSRSLHSDVLPVQRENVNANDTRETMPYYSIYEQVTLLGVRAQQIAEGARPLVSLEGINTSAPHVEWKIAERELQQNKIPYIIRRHYANDTAEFWAANELRVLKDK